MKGGSGVEAFVKFLGVAVVCLGVWWSLGAIVLTFRLLAFSLLKICGVLGSGSSCLGLCALGY